MRPCIFATGGEWVEGGEAFVCVVCVVRAMNTQDGGKWGSTVSVVRTLEGFQDAPYSVDLQYFYPTLSHYPSEKKKRDHRQSFDLAPRHTAQYIQ